MNNNGFNYSYSAKEQSEIKKIRDKYISSTASEETDKMAKLRRLDAGVTKKAEIVSLCLGIIGTLVMGFGLSLIMTDLKTLFALSETAAMIIGIAVGLVGMVSVLLAYPVYNCIVKKNRKKLAPEILRLTEELLNEKK